MIGNPLTILDEVDSSNNYAMALAIQGLAQHGSAFMALHQTAGKAQRGKVWHTRPGQNLALSVLLDMNQALISRQFALSTAIALGVYDYFSQYGLDDTHIKWPNDIYWRDRKAVGILLENKLKGQNWQWTVAGIGMNVNQTEFHPDIVGKAVSLKQITGKNFDLAALASQLCAKLQIRFDQFLRQEDTSLLADYNHLLFRKDRYSRLQYQNGAYNCLIRSVDAQGRLWIEGAPVPYFHFGEVEWLINP